MALLDHPDGAWRAPFIRLNNEPPIRPMVKAPPQSSTILHGLQRIFFSKRGLFQTIPRLHSIFLTNTNGLFIQARLEHDRILMPHLHDHYSLLHVVIINEYETKRNLLFNKTLPWLSSIFFHFTLKGTKIEEVFKLAIQLSSSLSLNFTNTERPINFFCRWTRSRPRNSDSQV